MDYLSEIQNPCICPRKEVRKGIILVDYFVTDTDFFVTLHSELLICSIPALSFFYRNHLFDFLESLSAL